MKLYGLLVVQNESDIIADLLAFLANKNIYEAIFLYDLGSTDDTFEKALKFKDILYEPKILNQPYTEKLRYDLLAEHRELYQKGDWLAIVDADEFYVDNPMEFIAFAESEGTTCIRTYQAQFMFTDADLQTLPSEDPKLPIYERRKHYLINWSEQRFFKFLPEHGLFDLSKPSSRRLINRHYQYRTPDQIDTRIRIRLENRKKTKHLRGRQDWAQIFSTDWRNYVVPHRVLHKYSGGQFKFGLPEGVRWKDYYTKDPFCGILPQIANLFEKERGATRITFQDSYAHKVFHQAHDDFFSKNWREAVDGLGVALKYYLRVARNSIGPAFDLVKFKIRNFAWNVVTSLKRIITGKSIGVLTAAPNPIEVSDISGAGITTLKWRSFFTQKIELRLDAPDGNVIHAGCASGSIATGNWLATDMVFYLQDVSNGAPPKSSTLSKVQIKITDGNKITI
jgi:hypothetical protein